MSDVACEGLVIDNTSDGLFRVNRRVFTDPHILELEHQRVFEHSWIYAGHESEIPQPGDFRARKVAGRPVILARGSDGQVRDWKRYGSAWRSGKEESAEHRVLRLDNFLTFLGPGGFATPDDVEMLESCQRGFVNREVAWSDISRGM